MEHHKLDAKDRKILSELDMNARQPVSKLAKKVRLSREVVNYRIKNLEKRGVIKGYYTAIDLTKIGFIFCRFFIKFQNTSEKKEQEIIAYLRNTTKVGWLYTIDGSWDIAFAIDVRDVSEIEEFYDELVSKFGNYLAKKYISLATKIYHFKHNYLYDEKDRD